MELIPTTSVLALRPVVRALARVGVPAAAYTARLGVHEDILDDDDARIPIYKVVYMWEHAAQLARDPDFGLHLAEDADETTFGAISALALVTPTIGDALRRVEQFAQFMAGSRVYELVVLDEIACLRSVRPRWAPMDRQATDLILGLPHVYCSQASVRPWQPIEVTFRHARPATSSEHARVFGCPLRFNARYDEIRFPAHLLSSPSRMRDDDVARMLPDLSKRLIDGIEPERDLVARVRVHVWDRLQQGDTSIESVARDVGLSERSLQRRLAEAHTSHREILEQVRATFAEHLLERGHKLIEIAMLLGFSEQTAFHKAFRRWTGTSPGSFRRAAVA